jgi:hypothetical protein
MSSDAKSPMQNDRAALRAIKMPTSPAKLISKVNAVTIAFLKTELAAGLSFARMAAGIRSRRKPRPGDAEKIKRYLGYSRQAYDVVSSHIANARGERQELRQITLKFSELKKLLNPDDKQL